MGYIRHKSTINALFSKYAYRKAIRHPLSINATIIHANPTMLGRSSSFPQLSCRMKYMTSKAKRMSRVIAVARKIIMAIVTPSTLSQTIYCTVTSR